MTRSIDFPKPTLISVNGVELEVFEAGQHNAGNPIVLCHGWPEHAFSWRHQMPPLAEAGYHVIVPNQRGYGNSSRPAEVTEYDVAKLSGDLVGLLDHFGYDDAVFVGHDWGAAVVWWLTLLHPKRVSRIVNLAVPYFDRGEKPWIEWMEELMGPDSYFVHFNRQPGVADAVFAENTAQFLRNLYRKNLPPPQPAPGMPLINLANAKEPQGDLAMTEDALAVFIEAFEATGFTGSINWYRNLDRNWHLLADVDPVIQQPALMVYGGRDYLVAKSETLAQSVPNVEVTSLDCGHWIQQEKPEETTRLILDWLARTPARDVAR
ncbi:MAG: alpha/beta fold hydrolase [Nannocystaceae bacterium]|nr:alpha/beta hydrolase [bacterium]